MDGGRTASGSCDQLGYPGDEALGNFDRLGRQLGGYLGARTGFIVGDGLEVVGETMEATWQQGNGTTDEHRCLG